METRLHGTNVIVAYYIALNTGLRESEVFGLRWEDIDFEKKKIKVCKQLLFQDRKWCFCPLKTKNAYRSVNITDSFCEYMKKLKKHHEENKKLYGDGYKRNFVTDRLERNRDILSIKITAAEQCSMYVHITRNATHMCAFIQEQIFRWEQWRTESFVSSEMRHTNIFQN